MKTIARTSRSLLARSFLLLLFASAMALPASAWDGSATGKISSIEVTAGTNYGFRIFLNGAQQALCTGGTSFAFLFESDSNYKVYVASLLLAKAQGSTVTIFSMNEGGFCHIGHVMVYS
jgi:hypothetical protein